MSFDSFRKYAPLALCSLGFYCVPAYASANADTFLKYSHKENHTDTNSHIQSPVSYSVTQGYTLSAKVPVKKIDSNSRSLRGDFSVKSHASSLKQSTSYSAFVTYDALNFFGLDTLQITAGLRGTVRSALESKVAEHLAESAPRSRVQYADSTATIQAKVSKGPIAFLAYVSDVGSKIKVSYSF
jgi:hypothetical protein